ncbi:hypothetical protein BKA67DRAFT_577262 [Truncatella angustata]|uniref:Uncharacterized protein n=1 Tax=Truncatella angustata TaxID=152316 RepID=A0A9P8RJU4_9PEZI|nr:uncharacterized protein BKA67DRAFT_577262 [Truncatella angustata]KAH6647375.1 hypothetical protein BKA67DRAFT_577262 [Truncatella angustata]
MKLYAVATGLKALSRVSCACPAGCGRERNSHHTNLGVFPGPFGSILQWFQFPVGPVAYVVELV